MKELTPRRQIVMVMGVLTAASAYLAFPLMSVAPSAHECIAADRMPLLGCIAGEAARQRAEGRWRIDPGMIIWDGASTLCSPVAPTCSRFSNADDGSRRSSP